ncbi:MAG: 16S rRNA (adenine(1518)-N(6)/adenine(1519)-N(6))-dimethyltransferase RsmA [Clostridia bacterium]|nr:16S rRNA (adenine(1518)-N(6)/adenine(1519)-N(6))-dimethyltransferase RsmA [Clostridia bacterium]
MQNLTDPRVIHALLAKNGAALKKALGQNFLIDPSVCPAMAEEAGIGANTCALEIGPGVGVLTAELAKRAKKVLAFEVDRALLPVLDETLADFSNVTVRNEDVLKADLAAVLETEAAGMDVVVCANLPYYITSPVLMKLLESRLPIRTITVMVQKEAAERLCAAVGTREGGAVTVAVAYYARAERLFGVGRDSFLPPPKVDSEVIRLTVREKPPVDVSDEAGFFRVVRAAFGQRRKTVENSLSAGLGLPKEAVGAALDACGLARSVRAEKLTLADFAALSEALN